MTEVFRQTGIVLASGLMLLAVISLSMTTVLTIAARELARTSIYESLESTGQTARLALNEAIAAATFDDTHEAVLHEGNTPNGTRYEVSVRFVGSVARPDVDSLADWHFVLTAMARSPAGAEVVEAQQVRIAAPPPADPAACLIDGCSVPPLCGPPACDPPLRGAAEPVAWHLPESLP